MQASRDGCAIARVAALALALALPAVGASAQTAEELAFARTHLGQLQARSLRTGREYCGFFGYDGTGRLVAVKARPGGAASCTAIWPHPRIRVFASYHTHGAWDADADGEVPSVEDMQGDMADGIHGYLSTPGGRFWFIDGPKGVARQICGPGCLAIDPAYPADEAIPERLTLEALKARQGE